MSYRKNFLDYSDIFKTDGINLNDWLPKSYGQPSSAPDMYMQPPVTQDVDQLNRQIGNYQTRYGAMGIDAGKEADNRNWFEKLTNLTPDQNFVFDLFELLNRPQEAITGAIQEATSKGNHAPEIDTSQMSAIEGMALREQQRQKLADQRNMSTGQKALQGFKKGFTGQENYYYGQVLRNVFQDGKPEDGKFDWTDGLGLVMDMTLDPMNLALGGAKAGAKGAQAVDTAGELAKGTEKAGELMGQVTKAKNAGKPSMFGVPEFLTDFSDRLNGIKSQTQIDKAKRFKDTMEHGGKFSKTMAVAGKATQPLSDLTNINRYLFPKEWNMANKTLTEATFDGIFNLGKGAGKAVKTGIDKGIDARLEFLKETNPAKAEDFANTVNDFQEDLRHLFSKPTKRAKEINFQTKLDLDDLANESKGISEKLFNEVHENMDDLKKLGFKDEQDVVKGLYQLRESRFIDEGMSVDEFMKLREYGFGLNNALPDTPELRSSLKQAFGVNDLGQLGIKPIGDGKALQFDRKFWGMYDNGEVADLLDTQAGKVMEDLLAKGKPLEELEEPLIKLGSTLKETEDFKRYQNIYENSPEFRKILDSYDSGFEQAQDLVGTKLFGDKHKLRDITDDSYLPRTVSDDALEFNKLMNPSDPEIKVDKEWQDTLNRNLGIGGQGGYTDGRYHGHKELKGRKIQGMTTHDADNVVVGGYRELFNNEEWVEKRVAEIGQQKFDQAKKLIEKPDFAWYTQDAYKSVMDYATNKTRAMGETKKKSGILLEHTFNKGRGEYPGLVFTDKVSQAPRKGYIAVDKFEARTMLRDMERMKEYGGGNKQLNHMIKELNSVVADNKKVFLSQDIAPFVKHMSGVSGDSILKGLEDFNNAFKSGKVMSPSFHANNIVSNVTNQLVGGIPGSDAFTYNAYASSFVDEVGDVGTGGLLDKKLSGAKLTAKEKEMLHHVDVLRKNGVLDQEHVYELHDVIDDKFIGLREKEKGLTEAVPNILKETGYQTPEHKKGGLIKDTYRKIGDKNMELNQIVDDNTRIATYFYGVDNPDWVKKLGVKDPVQAMKLLHYDPSDLTLLEDKYIKKVIPFYTFARMNAGLHLKNIFNNPQKYRDLHQFDKSIWGGLGVKPGDRRTFERENLSLPSLGTFFKGVNPEEQDEHGNYGGYKALKSSPSFTDAIDMIGDPMKWTASSMTPAIRMPFEVASGTQMFTGRPIEEYPGEKSKKFPWMSKKGEYALSQTGLDVPARSLQGLMDMLGGDIGGGANKAMNILQDGSMEQAHKQKAYDELKMYEELTRRLKAQGMEVPTLEELKRLGIIPR